MADGKLDVAVVADNKLLFYPGNGDGTFGEPIPYANGLVSGIGSMFTVDINRDGKVDLIVGGPTSSSPSEVLVGNGDGTFQAPIMLPLLVLVAADLNHDGNIDLVGVTPTTAAVSVLIGRGTGVFTAGPLVSGILYSNSLPGAYESITFSDFNGDGNVDLVLSQRSAGQVGTAQPSNLTELFVPRRFSLVWADHSLLWI
jgi:hypothetical protein